MFWNRTDYKAEVEQLTKEMANLTAHNAALQKQVEEAKEAMESSANEHAGYKKQIASLKKSNEEFIAIKDIEIAQLKESVNKRINSALAVIGVSTFANESFMVNNTDVSDMECLNTFNSLAGQEKTEYYNKNKAKITRALLQKS